MNTARNKVLFALFTTCSIGIFTLLMWGAHNLRKKSTDIQSLTLIRKGYTHLKIKFLENDGLVFENQDKNIYNELIRSNKAISVRKVRHQLSPEEIMSKLFVIKSANNPRKISNVNKKEKSVFSVLN
tara:strand:+ start:393 stop:773 length:381 start_codon:yes stop_codon:yes gene_type:complete